MVNVGFQVWFLLSQVVDIFELLKFPVGFVVEFIDRRCGSKICTYPHMLSIPARNPARLDCADRPQTDHKLRMRNEHESLPNFSLRQPFWHG